MFKNGHSQKILIIFYLGDYFYNTILPLIMSKENVSYIREKIIDIY